MPHSCGEVCGRSRGEPCVHKCVDICHAGPCPTCTATVLVSCPCGRETQRLKYDYLTLYFYDILVFVRTVET